MSRPLWRWRELCEALGIAVVDGPDISGISIDSRTVQPGELFIALTGDPGPRFNPSQRSDRDGHDFVASALERGAAGVLVHDQQPCNCPQLIVGDTLDGLWALGRAARTRLRCPVVAVTGSSGKTTVKAMLTVALDAFSTPGSLNNHLGVPLSLARTPAQVKSAVVEIGTNHPGEIAPLSRLTQPDVAIVLNVHPAHRANFASMAELRSEKLSISQGLRAGGTLVVHDQIDDAEIDAKLPRVRFGKAAHSDIQLLTVDGVTAQYRIVDQQLQAHVPGGGEHRALSLAAVFAVTVALGRDPVSASDLNDDLIPTGRGAQFAAGGITLIDDSYNANPMSMKAALQTLSALPGRRYALLGEMLELGDESAEFHAGLAGFCEGLTGVFCVGDGMTALAAKLNSPQYLGYWETVGDDLLSEIKAILQPGDTLLVKGSNRVFWAVGFVDKLREALSADQ